MRGKFNFQQIISFIQSHPKFKNGAVLFLLIAILLQVVYIHPINIGPLNASLSATASVYSSQVPKDLVVILVEEELFNDDQNYQNQFTQNYNQVQSTDIQSRVERYAEDIQKVMLDSSTPGDSIERGTESAIIPVSSNQSPSQIASMLKQAYHQNLNSLQDSKLVGLVIVGDVPLPVVNKSGNLFPSIYPYTDFENPAFLLNQSSNYFEPIQNTDPSPEIWHGVINLNTASQIAEYLDKNHLYHQGVEEFSEFDSSIFFSEPHHDVKSFNQDLYSTYQTYISAIEEFSYNRYSRNLLNFLSQNSSGFLADAVTESIQAATQGQSIKQLDIFTKPNIESYITPITEVFTVALRNQRDALLSTGRYQDSDYSTGLLGIAKIDELSGLYLKQVNQIIEDEIDTILDDVQVDIPLVEGAKLTPILQVTDQNGNTTNQAQEPISFVNHSRQGDPLQLYLNLVPGLSDSLAGLPTDQIIDQLFTNDNSLLSEEDLITGATLKINGTRYQDINTASQCRLFRGGGTTNIFDKTVRTHRGLILNRDPQVENPAPVCYKPYDSNDPEETWTQVTTEPGLLGLRDNVYRCTTFAGRDLQDIYRMDEVQLDYQSPLTSESCYGMRTTEDYLTLLKAEYAPVDSDQELQQTINLLNSIPDYENLTIATYQGQSLQLSDLINQVPAYRSLKLTNSNSNFDWHAFSSQILANPVQSRFTIENPISNQSNLQAIILDVQKYETGKSVPSLIKHADPTPGVISNAYEAVNPDLPINATRYATFMDKNGRKQELVYPNLFKTQSLPQFRQQLTQLEDVLTQLSKSNTDYSGRLLSLIQGQQDQVESADLTQANQTKLAFLLQWLNFDLNQKYEQVHTQLLTKNNPLQLNNLPNSYEIAHITGETINQNLDFNLLDFSDLEVTNPETERLESAHSAQLKQSNIESKQTTQTDSIDILTYFTQYLPSWYQEQQSRVSQIIQSVPSPQQSASDIFGTSDGTPTQIQVNPTSIIHTTDSPNTLRLTLVDNSGIKILSNQTVNLTSNLPSELQTQIDQNSNQPGTQINFFGGIASLNLNLSEPGNYQLQFQNQTIQTNYNFQVLSNPTLEVTTSSSNIQAGNQAGLQISVQLKDGSEVIPFPKPNLRAQTNSNQVQLSYLGDSPQLDTTHTYILLPGQKSTSVELQATLDNPQLESQPQSVQVQPGPVAAIKLTTDTTKITSRGISQVEAVLVDEFQNPVYQTSSNYQLQYDSTQNLQVFPQQIQFNQGKATLEFQAKPLAFGNVFLEISSSNNSEVQSGFHKLIISSELDLETSLGENFNSLILNLFTDQSSFQSADLNNMLATSSLQSISTLTTDLKANQPVLYVHASGGILQVPGQSISKITAFNSSIFTTKISDNQNNQVVELSTNISSLPVQFNSNGSSNSGVHIEYPNPDNIQTTDSAILFNQQEVITFDQNQIIQSISPQVKLELVDGTYHKLALSFDQTIFAYLTIKSNTPNQVTIKPNSRNPQITYQRAYTLNSTSSPQGYKFINQKQLINQSQLPNSPDIRMDDFLQNKTTGLTQGSKLLHLLSASNPVGIANQPHLSEAGIVLGDPMVKLPKQNQATISNMNFDSTLGTYLTRKTDTQVADILEMPKNQKVAIAYQDGTVSLYDQLTGVTTENWLKVPNGIRSAHLAEFTEDQETIVFLTAQECYQNDSCIYVFNPHTSDQKTGQLQAVSPNLNSQDGYELDRNNLSTLNRLDLNLPSKPTQILINDMNNDDRDDLIVLGEDEILYLFWNQSNQIQSQPSPIGHTRISFQDDEYLTNKLLINNLPASLNAQSISEISLPIQQQATSDQIQTAQALKFAQLSSVDSLQQSTARAVDLDGNTLENGDQIQYTINLSNTSSQTLQDLNLSLPIPTNQTLQINSLSPSNLNFISTTDTAARRFLITDLDIPAQGFTEITFTTIYQKQDSSQPAIVSINPASNESQFPVQDNYPDLKILIPGNDAITYFYSDYQSENNTLRFRRTDITQTNQVSPPSQALLDQIQNLNPLPEGSDPSQDQEDLANSLAEQTIKQDSDGDGIIDIYDGNNANSLDQAGARVEKLVSDLSCGDGGCLAVPKNKAFLVPDNELPGTELPAFAWGCPPSPTGAFIPFWPPQPFQACSGGRIYVSPTLTGEFAGSVCVGPHRLGACFTFNIADLGKLCDVINKKVQDVITKASDFVETESGGVITVGGGGSQDQESNIQIPSFPAVLTEWVTNQWKEIQDKLLDPPDINVIYPDPRSALGYITPQDDSSQRQFLFVDPYPSCNSLQDFQSNPSDCGNLSSYNDVLQAKQNAKQQQEFNSIQDLKTILNEIAMMPLFDINYETVYINYPLPDKRELDKFISDLSQLKDQILLEVLVTGNQWGCFANTNYTSVGQIKTALDEGNFLQSIGTLTNQGGSVQTACIQLAAGVEGIDLNIRENINRINQYRDLPKNIVEVENFVANYADQILQYAEVVLESIVGFITENTNNLVQWEQAILEVENSVQDLKILLDFSADFMESCDDCRSNRTNDGIQTLINIFANLAPELPVIEVPSFPDITLDVSEIQAGIDVTLPDFQLKQDPITFPDINLNFQLPDTPQAAISIDNTATGVQGITLDAYLDAFQLPILLPEPPNLQELEIIQNLPELPDLEIPQLPTIPKPPSINNFTADFTAKVEPTIKVLTRLVRIYCLISKGLVPMPEGQIQSQIETMTNRPLTPVLPIDLSFQLPNNQLEAQYIDEIIFKITTQLNLSYDQILEQSQSIANQLNSASSNLGDQVEDGLDQTLQGLYEASGIVDPDTQTLNPLGEEATEAIEDANTNLNIQINPEELTSFSEAIQEVNLASQEIAQAWPEKIELKASTQNFQPSSSQTNFSLQDFQSHPLVAQLKSSSTTQNLVASTSDLDTSQPVIKTQSFQLGSSYLAQSNSPTSTPPAEFNPENGVYTVDEQGNVQKLISYNSPSQAQSQVTIFDADQDGDDDIIYSLENSIFFKENKAITESNTANPSNPRTYDFQDLFDATPAINLATVSTPDLSFSFQHNQVTANIPANLQTQNLILDVYKVTIQGTENYQRYFLAQDITQELDEQDFQKSITILNQPTVNIPLSNGNYLARLSLYQPDSESSQVLQSNILLTPNTCGDSQPPIISLNSDREIDVPLFGYFDLDLGATRDLESSIAQIYIDNNLSQDSNQDGDPTNDPNLQGQDNPASTNFRLGPFNQLQTKRYRVYAEDINGNTSSLLLTLNVVPPDITITEGQNREINGQLDPISGNTPIALVRQRNGVVSKLAEVTTDSNGQFTYQPQTNSEIVTIEDINQKELFQINKQTGSILILDQSASLQFLEWEEGTQNTATQILVNNTPLTQLQRVSDSAFTPFLSDQSITQSLLDSSDIGVHVQDINPQNNWRAQTIQNQVVISNSSNQPSVTISSSGQIQILDSNLNLEVSEIQNIDQLQTYDVYADSLLQFSIFINPANSLQIQDPSEIQTTTTRNITFNPNPLSSQSFQDVDSSNPNQEAINRLRDLGIVEGIRTDNGVFFQPERDILRSEFSKIILEALCLSPSPQSKLPPQAFSDIPYQSDNPLWYYDYTKETQLLGLFNGYLAEQDPSTGLYPFKPSNNITLAETAKVILEALEYKSVIQFDLPQDYSGPWYEPYLQIAQNLDGYITPQAAQTNQLQNNQLLTPQEIANPNQTVTREEFAVIASRVLDLYNCFELESESNQDPDQNSNDQNPDPDQSNQSPDQAQDSNTQVELIFPNPGRPGLYLNQIPCNSCPCAYTIRDENDIIKSDIIFAVLLGPNQQVYSQSNLLKINQ